MTKLDKTGPDGQGSGTGRKLGRCSKLSDKEKLEKLGKGMGKRRKSTEDKGKGKVKGKRLKSGKQ
jgi:hypothetical protein